MNKTLNLLTLIALLLCSPAQSDNLAMEAVPTLYFKLPLDDRPNKSFAPRLGFRVDKIEYEINQGINLFSSPEPALLDLSFRQGRFDRLSFSGVNTLESRRVYNANGTSSTMTQADKDAMMMGMLFGIGIIVALVNSDTSAVCAGTGCPEPDEP
ncbi:MAG: hypothetical protein GY696_29915 [Gammaproteobacteria bacterium]|nr:hypothetical protein [Gammaproteobacteria bacterium]